MSRVNLGRIAAGALASLLVTFAVVWPHAVAPVRAATAVVVIGDALSPAALQVTPGASVTWRNDSGNRHRIRSTSGPEEFDSGDIHPGGTFTFTFSVPGTYQYRDERNKELSAFWGTVTVASTASPSPTLPPGATPPPNPPNPLPGDILMAGRVFNPRTVTVDAGTAVRWRNNDGREHTVTANDRSFDSGLMPVGATFVRTLRVPGTFAYICAIHPDMTGTIAVRATGGGTPPPPPPPTPRPTAPAVSTGDYALRDFAFVPSAIRVAPGTTITWLNTGVAPHTVTDGAGAFDSGLLNRGARWSRTFSSPGTFQLLCTIHPEMRATLVVAAPGTSAPPAVTAPPPAPAPPVQAPAAGSLSVAMVDFDFAPAVVRVSVGTTVSWVNQGVAPHTVTAKNGSFDSGFLATGETWAQQFASEGTFEYLCSIHPAMIGTVVVSGGSQPSAGTGSPSPDAIGGGATGGGATLPGDGTGSGTVPGPGSGQEPGAPVRGLPPGPPPTESLLRLTLVAAIGLGAVASFGILVRSTMRRA